MRQMAALRGPVDAFFDEVKVNARQMPKMRENRLHLAGLRLARGAALRIGGFLKDRRLVDGMTQWVYAFGDGKAEGEAGMKNLLGGKGANLAEMSNLGLPVPPGFSITTEVCTYYYANRRNLSRRSEGTGRRRAARRSAIWPHGNFGDPDKPLLVSVRSGARVSMPGMMDTVLNLGLNAATTEGLAKLTGDAALRL